jgi:hypothetical protein
MPDFQEIYLLKMRWLLHTYIRESHPAINRNLQSRNNDESEARNPRMSRAASWCQQKPRLPFFYSATLSVFLSSWLQDSSIATAPFNGCQFSLQASWIPRLHSRQEIWRTWNKLGVGAETRTPFQGKIHFMNLYLGLLHLSKMCFNFS